MSSRAMPAMPGWLRAWPGAVVQLSPEGVVQQSNGRLEAVLDAPVVGRPFSELLDQGPSLGKWARMLDAGEAIGWELILCAGDTSLEPRRFSLLRSDDAPELWLVEHPEDARVDAIRTAVTEVNSALVQTQRDLVREQARLAAVMTELERSNRALDDFAHVVSHDLRAPLRNLGNYSTWIEEDLGEAAAPAARHLAGLRAQVARLQRMVDGVLRLARNTRLQAQPEEVDVGAVVAEVTEMLAPPAGVRVTVDGELPTLRTERVPLLQVLLNLIANAIAHGGEGVHVRVSAVDRGANTELTVADSGPGVPPAMRDRVWGLFHTGASGAESRGAGIGLAIVKRLVEDRGGRAWVDEAPGGGAAFHFTWPKQSRRGNVSGR